MNSLITGTPGSTTVTETSRVTTPFEFVADRVKVCEAANVFAKKSPVTATPSNSKLSALKTSQLRVELSPGPTMAGVASNSWITGMLVTVTTSCAVESPLA